MQIIIVLYSIKLRAVDPKGGLIHYSIHFKVLFYLL